MAGRPNLIPAYDWFGPFGSLWGEVTRRQSNSDPVDTPKWPWIIYSVWELIRLRSTPDSITTGFGGRRFPPLLNCIQKTTSWSYWWKSPICVQARQSEVRNHSKSRKKISPSESHFNFTEARQVEWTFRWSNQLYPTEDNINQAGRHLQDGKASRAMCWEHSETLDGAFVSGAGTPRSRPSDDWGNPRGTGNWVLEMG